MSIIENREIVLVKAYEIHCVPVINNMVPQIIITVPTNYNNVNIDQYLQALLCKIYKDYLERNPNFLTYEIALDDSFS